MRQMNDIPINPMPRPPRQRPRPEAAEGKLSDYLAKWPTRKLRRERRQYNWMGKAAMLAIPVCFLAGLWLDWRFLPTLLLPVVLFAMSVKAVAWLDAELAGRDDTERTDAAERLRDCLPADESDNGPVEVPADALRTLIREGRE